jgi:hypothetical protein
MAISYVAGSQFEVPAFRDFSVGGWSQTSGTAIAANSTGGALNYLVFNIFFEDPQLQPTVFNFYAWNGTTLLEATRATFDGGAWSFQPIPVPEPTTMIAGALLLLPFGISTIRRLRRS